MFLSIYIKYSQLPLLLFLQNMEKDILLSRMEPDSLLSSKLILIYFFSIEDILFLLE